MQSAYKQRCITDSVNQLQKHNVRHQYNKIDHQHQPLVWLTWDPWEFYWKNQVWGNKPMNFFQYSVKLGRHVLVKLYYRTPSAKKSWQKVGNSQGSFGAIYWPKNKYKKSLFSNGYRLTKAIAVRDWGQKQGFSLMCPLYEWPMETQSRCLWNYKRQSESCISCVESGS
jgi:hypothetical protein